MIKKNQTKYNAAFRILRPTPNFGKQFSPESDLHETLNRIKSTTLCFIIISKWLYNSSKQLIFPELYICSMFK